jgi:hypothetical protein
VTSELVVTTVGEGVITTTGIVVNDVSVEVKVEVGEEAEADDVGVDVDVAIEGIERADDKIELEGHEDPKRVANTVTGTLTVTTAGTLTVVVLPEKFVRNKYTFFKK